MVKYDGAGSRYAEADQQQHAHVDQNRNPSAAAEAMRGVQKIYFGIALYTPRS
jgi:hypothetical protein